MPRSLFRCRESFRTVDSDGLPRRVGIGDVVSSDDWVYRGRESLFEPAEAAASRVEQATAAPGERRNVSHPTDDETACDVDGCDFVAKSAAGLAAHKRSHDED